MGNLTTEQPNLQLVITFRIRPRPLPCLLRLNLLSFFCLVEAISEHYKIHKCS